MTQSITSECQPGDIVFAAMDLHNDGTHPEFDEEAIVVAQGTRGVVVNTGYSEVAPDQELLLVRFELKSGVLGPPIGCWARELTWETGSLSSN
jgi:nitrogen fixation protein NifZ